MNSNKKQLIRSFICLGSNIGDKKANIEKSLKLLEEKGIIIEKCSSFYQTEPVEVKEQPWFLNLVAKINTFLSPEELLHACQEIEKDLGRKSKGDKNPRTIDIDILLYGDDIVQKSNLQIPHSRMHLRRFMLEPLAEIAPSVIHPIFKKIISQLLKQLKDTSKVIKLKKNEKNI